MRDVTDWTREIALNLSLVRFHVKNGIGAVSFAVALKEVRRTGSDLRRMQQVDEGSNFDYERAQEIVARLEHDVYLVAEAHGFTREQVDNVRV